MSNQKNLLAPQVAAAAVVIKDSKVLLVKRASAPNKGLWAIPGGSVELGETLQQAAEREIREETGLTVKAGEPMNVFDFIERDEACAVRFHYVIVDVAAVYISGEITPADDAADAGWFGVEELKGIEVSSNTAELLKKIGFI
jgi:ADP-ribose pyrophosphatase